MPTERMKGGSLEREKKGKRNLFRRKSSAGSMGRGGQLGGTQGEREVKKKNLLSGHGLKINGIRNAIASTSKSAARGTFGAKNREGLILFRKRKATTGAAQGHWVFQSEKESSEGQGCKKVNDLGENLSCASFSGRSRGEANRGS